MYKSYRIILMVLIVLLFFTGCSRNAVKGRVEAPTPSLVKNGMKDKLVRDETIPSLDNIDYSKIEISIVENLVLPDVGLKTGIVGKAQFSVDASKTVSAEYDPDGKEVSLKLTDKTGVTWCLTIPDKALINKQIITMTALSDVSIDTVGRMDSGVLLEPDGLHFLKFATLTATGADLDKSGMMFVAGHDGSSVDFSVCEIGQNGLSAKIRHFSSALAGTPSEDEGSQLVQTALNQLRAAQKATRDLFNQPILVPVPPTIPFSECNDVRKSASVEESIKRFLEDFSEPELKVIHNLFTCEWAYNHLSGESIDIAFPLSEILSYRLVLKAELLIAEYKQDPDKFEAIKRASFHAVFTHQAYSEKDVSYLERFCDLLGDWAIKIEDHFIDEVREKHDFTALYGAKNAALAAMGLLDNYDLEAFIKKVNDVMIFKLVIKNKLQADAVEWTVEGDIPLLLDYPYDGISFFSGEGSGIYTAFTSPEKNVKLKMPNNFPVKVLILDFTPCKPDFKIYIDRFGAETETLMARGVSVPAPGVVQNSMSLMFYNNRKIFNAPANDFLKKYLNFSGQYFSFDMEFNNKQETVCRKNFTKSLNGLQAEYSLELIHTPK